jgi:hypothetical protein
MTPKLGKAREHQNKAFSDVAGEFRHDQKLNIWIPGLAADWEASHGGELRIHPQQADGSNKKPHVDIAPLHDRFLIFYSDR